TRSVVIANNLFTGIGAPELGGPGTLFQIINGAADIRIEHNTAIHAGTILSADMQPSRGLVFQGNIVEHNEYGVSGSGKGIGLPALDYYFPGYVFRKNLLVANPFPRQYPPDNLYPAN